MAILQTAQAASNGTTTFQTFTGPHKLLTVFAGANTTLTYNGLALTAAGACPWASSFYQYYLVDPPVGTFALSSSITTFLDIRGFTGADIIANPFGTLSNTGGGSTGSTTFYSGVTILGTGNYAFLASNYYPTASVATWATGTQDSFINAFNGATGGNSNFSTSIQSSSIAANSSGITVQWNLTSGPNTPSSFPAMYTVHESLAWATSSSETSVVTDTTSVLSATVNGNGYSAGSTYIEYGLTTAYGTVLTSVATQSGAFNYTQTVTGLTANTLYHFRVVASNGNGVEPGSDFTFTTLVSPSVATQTATSLTGTSSNLNSQLFNSNRSSIVYFQYGVSTGAYSFTSSSIVVGASTSSVLSSVGITGLTLGTTYYYRAVLNVNGTIYTGSELTFTASNPPVVTVTSVTLLSNTTVTLNGTVNPGGLATTYNFQYGLTTSLGTSTAVTSAGSGTTAVSVSANLTSLVANTTYYYRVSAVNTNGTNTSSISTLTTQGLATIVSVTALDPVVYTTNSINFVPEFETSSITYSLNYGVASGVYTTSITGTVLAALDETTISVSLTNLVPNQVYYYQLVLTNAYGSTTSVEKTFATFNNIYTTQWSLNDIPPTTTWTPST